MSYPDPKLVKEAQQRGLALPNPRVVMGSPLRVDPKTGKVTSAKPHDREEMSTPDSGKAHTKRLGEKQVVEATHTTWGPRLGVTKGGRLYRVNPPDGEETSPSAPVSVESTNR